MNGLTIIYIIGALAVGFLIGMILELILDSQTIRELQNDNHKLKLNIEQLQKEAKEKEQAEIIQILDYRQRQSGTYFKPF